MISYQCPSCGQAGECSDFLAHMAIHCKKCYHSIRLSPKETEVSRGSDVHTIREAKKIVKTATPIKPGPARRPTEATNPSDLFLFTTGFNPSEEDQSLAIESLVLLNPHLPSSELNSLDTRIYTLPGRDRQTLVDNALKRVTRTYPEARMVYAVRENHTPGEHMVIVAVWPMVTSKH